MEIIKINFFSSPANYKAVFFIGILVLFSNNSFAKRCLDHETKIIGRITIDQMPFQKEKVSRKVPFIVWDALKKGFSSLIYDAGLCMKQNLFSFKSSSIDESLPLKPVKNMSLKTPRLVTEFYQQYDELAEDFLSDQLERQRNKMSIVVYWETAAQEDILEGLKSGVLELSYTIFDAGNYTETPFLIELEMPITSRKKATEKIATDIYEQLKNIKENISVLDSE